MKKIFPKEFLTKTIEYHRHQKLKKSQYIYLTLIIGLLVAFVLLPFIHIDLYSSSRGMIRPEKQRNIVNSPVNGKVKTVKVIENSFVQQGDTMVILDNQDLSQIIYNLKVQTDSLNLDIRDLNYLLETETSVFDSLKSNQIKTLFSEHLVQTKSIKDDIHWNLKDYKRQKRLFQLGVISRKEFEGNQERLNTFQNKLALCKIQYKNYLSKQLQSKTNELSAIESKILQSEKQKSQHFIIAPVDGTVQELVGIEKNNFVYTGASIAHISPQTDLLVECFVNPSDIGMIKKNHPVTFQIDAFDHNYWGCATGEIKQISEDNFLLDNIPMFKVICSLNEKNLLLDKNIKGQLKKGMTLNAHFFIKTRTALQLVFDTMNDWY